MEPSAPILWNDHVNLFTTYLYKNGLHLLIDGSSSCVGSSTIRIGTCRPISPLAFRAMLYTIHTAIGLSNVTQTGCLDLDRQYIFLPDLILVHLVS